MRFAIGFDKSSNKSPPSQAMIENWSEAPDKSESVYIMEIDSVQDLLDIANLYSCTLEIIPNEQFNRPSDLSEFEKEKIVSIAGAILVLNSDP